MRCWGGDILTKRVFFERKKKEIFLAEFLDSADSRRSGQPETAESLKGKNKNQNGCRGVAEGGFEVERRRESLRGERQLEISPSDV